MIEGSIRALGRFVADEALRRLSDTAGPVGLLRVSGFDHQTVVEALHHVQHHLLETSSWRVVVKVGTSDPTTGVPTAYLLDPEHQLTRWRNVSDHDAVLLFEWENSPDEQGLATMNALDDATILGDPASTAEDTGFRRFLTEAWRQAAGDDPIPSLLSVTLHSIWEAVSAEDGRSLRRWADFLAESCQKVAALEVRSSEHVHAQISAALPSLDLFPDRDLFIKPSGLAARVTKNIFVSAFKQPSGKDISEDDLLERISAAELSSPVLNHLGVDEVAAKERMRNAVLHLGAQDVSQRHALRREQDLVLWLEIFERKSQKVGLGQQVRFEIERQDAARVDEFDAMMVEGPLDSGDQEAAQKFLDELPVGDAVPLADLLSKGSRRRVEKLAYPDAQLVYDPMRALLRELTFFSGDDEGTVVVSIEGKIEEDTGAWSRWLFAFLHAKTLGEIQASATGLRLTLEVADSLMNLDKPALPDADEPFEPATQWAPLRILVGMEGAAQRRFRWDPLSIPGQIALAALIQGWRTTPGQATRASFDDFLAQFYDPRSWQVDAPLPATSFAGRFEALKREHLAALSKGLSAMQISDYVAAWESVLSEARAALVPQNAPDPDLEAVVLSDVVELTDHRLMMLATHPLKLRWLAHNYDQVAKHIKIALENEGGLVLNRENEDLFFDAIDRISPHGTPAALVGPKGTIAIPMRESAGHEEYAPVRFAGNESKEWLASVDETAIDEMGRVITDYLTTYPHKIDGLRVLLLNRNGDPILPMRVAKHVRAKNPGVKVDLVVLAPQVHHHEIIQSFDMQFSGTEMSGDGFLPDLQLILQAWEPNLEADLSGLEDSIDIALAPALFGTQANIKESTKKESLSGHFDPWKHPASHNVNQTSQNVVRQLLPESADHALESWSTLGVRAHRRSPVSGESVDGIDYFEMQVQFDQHQDLFSQLHQVSHWVVTLDSFIGREQIDALQDRPDVILVKPSVGKNESYTLIVSSQTGKQFVVRRLSRRLEQIGVCPIGLSESTARRVYEVGRNVVPGAILRSLGIGTTVNEIVGLVATRFIISQGFPVPAQRASLVTWISFDEHHRWFGRGHKTRADLGRFVLTVEEDDTVSLDILVAESKFRQTFDVGAAEEQLNRTTDLCHDAFRTDDQARNIDRPFWLDELAAAITQTSGDATRSADLPARRVIGDVDAQEFEAKVLDALRADKVRLRNVAGVAVAVAADDESPAPAIGSLGNHTLVRLNKRELQDIIGALVAEQDPDTADLPVHMQELPVEDKPGLSAAIDSPAQTTGKLVSGTVEPTPSARPVAPPSPIDNSPAGAIEPTLDLPTTLAPGGLGEDELRRRYNKVLDVFAVHKVNVEAPATGKWQEGPGFYIFRFLPKPGVTVDKLTNRRDEIFLALALPSGFNIRTRTDLGTVLFEIPKVGGEKYGVDANALWKACPVDSKNLTVPLGTDIGGAPISIDLSSADSPHLLVAGTTGSGKSVALDTLLKGLLRYDESSLRLRLVDPKGTELVDFEEDPHLDGTIGIDAADAIDILTSAVDEMEARYKRMKSVRARKLVDYNSKVGESERNPWIVIVLDEYADLTSDPEDKKRIEALLQRLTQKARAAGIHIIAATQRPSANVISTTIRSNFPAQLALRVKTATDSRIILDEAGAEALAGQGDALFNTAAGGVRIQVAFDGSSV